ncbi:MAG: cyclic pyranopterin monophosphate synthase MoaC [Verrucomicrobiota bacterium]|jgi:cyclic pyranopterin phosphate synthase
MIKFSHLDAEGRAKMVDVGHKVPQVRIAVAEGSVLCRPQTIAALRGKKLPKGDVFTVAKVAAILAAKRVDELIPLSHSVPLDAVEVHFYLRKDTVHISAEARTTAKTGVEMEALTAVAVAALTVYDMCKAVDRTMVIEGVRLVSKVKQ